MAKRKQAKTSTAAQTKVLTAAQKTGVSLKVRSAARDMVLSRWTQTDPTKKGRLKLNKNMRPLGGLQVFPAFDPLKPQDRALFRKLMEELSWIQRANVMIQKLVVTNYVTSIEPRKDSEIKEDDLKKWRHKKIKVPYFDTQKTPNEIKQWIDRLASRLDLQSIAFNAYLWMREQGRAVVGMFPETRFEDPISGEMRYAIPEALRVIPPEYTRRPLLNTDDGSLEAVEVTGLHTNGGRLDANRAIYITNASNLNLFADFYGRSSIAPLSDVGRVLLTIYGDDFLQASRYTWHQPKVFRVEIPARDYNRVDDVLDEFLNKANNSAGKDIAVTQKVELLNPSTNAGDIAGLVQVQNECIDVIAGFYNIPAFMLAKEKAGRLGGNANREELDAFLNTEIRPEQIILENTLEAQFYDRILAILFEVEPEEVTDPNKVPVRIRHSFNKPDIAVSVNIEQYEIAKDMLAEGYIDPERMLEKFNLRDLLKQNTTGGEDASPTIKTWERKNPLWSAPKLSDKEKKKLWKVKNLKVGWPRNNTNEVNIWSNEEDEGKQKKEWS